MGKNLKISRCFVSRNDRKLIFRNFKLLKIPKAKTLKRVQGDIFRYLFVMLNSFLYLALQKAVAEGDLI